jgi:hypothetical protein
LRERAAGTHRRYAGLLLDWLERHRGWSPPTDLPDSALDEVALEECGAFVTNAALAFVLSRRVDDRELARGWALAMCELPRAERRNYGLGIYAAGLARAYDWLYDEWSDSERLRLREHLAWLVHQLCEGSIPGHERAHWWADAHLHHDFWIPVAGFGEAALALLGEVEEAIEWAAGAYRAFLECFSWLGDDGAWHEGAADWCYALAPLLWFYGAWQSVTGEDPHDLPWLRNTALFRVYHHLPDGTYVYLNDSFRGGRYNTSGSAACHLLRRLAALFRDGRAQWLAEKDEAFDLRHGPKGVFQAPYEGGSFRAERTEYPHSDAQCAAWNLLWYDPSVTAEPPARLPRSRHFSNVGVSILREGWGEDDAVVSLSCGPLAGHRCAERMRGGQARTPSNFSHAHADYNSLTLFARGQYFLVPPGYARRGSHFQNVVSVNGADFRVEPDLDIRLRTLVQEADFAYACGDATAAFAPHLGVAGYQRHVVLLGGCLVLFDDLRLASRATRSWNWFQWTLHSDPGTHELSFAGLDASWTPRGTGSPRLLLNVLEPAEFAWEHSALASRRGESMLESLRLVRPEWYSDRAQVLAVFSWEDAPARPVLLRHAGWLGVAWPERPARPGVGFVTTTPDGAPVGSSGDLPPGGPALLLFGSDPGRPDRYVRSAC